MRTAIYLLCGLLGGVGGGLLVHALREEPVARVSREERAPAADEDLRARVELLERRLEVRARTPDGGGAPAELPELADRPEGSERASAGEQPGPEGGADAERRASVQRIVDFARTSTLGPLEANRLFGALTRDPERIQAVIDGLRGAIEENPNNAELRVALATALVAKLTNLTPPGPQQGLVWGEAAQAYDKAIELDPQHWQARFGKAMGTTFIPPQFGQQPYAIRQFEELLQVQQGRAPEPHHAWTYFQLGRLYKDQGNLEKAREVWERGRKLFPDDPQLKEQLEVATTK